MQANLVGAACRYNANEDNGAGVSGAGEAGRAAVRLPEPGGCSLPPAAAGARSCPSWPLQARVLYVWEGWRMVWKVRADQQGAHSRAGPHSVVQTSLVAV